MKQFKLGCFAFSLLLVNTFSTATAQPANMQFNSPSNTENTTAHAAASVKPTFIPAPVANTETTQAPIVPQPQSTVPYNQSTAPANGTLTVDHPIYTLQLNSNPTTGYSWFLVSYPADLLSITKHEYIPPKTNMAGAGGYEMWVFTAKPEAFVAPRAIKIQMVYARPWEVNDQMTSQTFYVVTR